MPSLRQWLRVLCVKYRGNNNTWHIRYIIAIKLFEKIWLLQIIQGSFEIDKLLVMNYTETYFSIFYDICCTLSLLLMLNTYAFMWTSCHQKLGHILSKRRQKSVRGVLPQRGVLPHLIIIHLSANHKLERSHPWRQTIHKVNKHAYDLVYHNL